jgi:hypothetical protein
MLKQFIQECLLFRSDEKMHKVFGAVCWLSILLFVYAVTNLITTW